MENQRIFLYLALAVLALLLWDAWQRDYVRPLEEPPTAEEQIPEAAPTAPREHVEDPTAEAPTPRGPDAVQASAVLSPRGDTVRVVTDLLEVEISARGGDIRSLKLRQYPQASPDDPRPFILMSDRHIPITRDLDTPIFVAQSGLIASDEREAPGHRAWFEPRQSEYVLADDQDRITVPLVWVDDAGVEVVKRYTFHRDSYRIDLAHEVRNNSEQTWEAYQYSRLLRTRDLEGRSMFKPHTFAYTGGVIYSEEDRYQKISFGDMESERLGRNMDQGWAAFIQHYFLGAWIPPQDQTLHYYTRVLQDDHYVLGMASPRQRVEPGHSATFENAMFVGPKEQHRLREMAPGLDLTVDYGFLTVISKPLFWLLDRIHSLVGNWGWAIILLTLLIKIVFYKLSETSYRSMARMRKMQPKMMQLKERYGDDRQKLNQQLMELYKKEKINPLGGCLPILVQIPVFIALYWVLLESVELRHAPFILWIQDLSVRDPYYVLPILMGVSMVLQQRLNPAPLDPIQQKVMMFLPVLFTVFFLVFPAGLVLYWVTNNTLSIAQQWVITRRIEREPGRGEERKKPAADSKDDNDKSS